MTKKTRPAGGDKPHRSRKKAEQPASRSTGSSPEGPSPEPAVAPAGIKGQAIPMDFAETARDNLPTIVGIAASAGGMEAITQVLSNLPPRLNMALVLIQHLSPNHESFLPQLLAQKSALPVFKVTDDLLIEPGRVYVIPPNAQMEVVGKSLRLTARRDDLQRFMPADFFLRSLALAAGSRAIGIVLSGTDSDGAAGLREIKAVGGITIAQDPDTAKFDGMPRAALATGAVDLSLSPQAIAAELVRIATHPFVRPAAAPSDDELHISEDQLQQIFTLLGSAVGVDFTQYKQPTIRRRLQRRMVLHRLTGIEQYLHMLQETPGEVTSLYRDILIHVTRFFREPESFDALAEFVFPKILAGATSESMVRVWVPGCSTGEEAYSMAIAIFEYLKDDRNVPMQVFATDVSESAIEFARAAVYPESIAAEVSPERLRRFFTKTESGYRINKRVRDACVFARQDLTRDPPFSKLDLIVCRNVLIYFGSPLQKRLINIFHYALKPTGFLMLSGAETVGMQEDLFAILDKKHKVYEKRRGMARPDVAFSPPQHSSQIPVPLNKGALDARGSTYVQNEANQYLLNHYAPPGVIVDEQLQIVQFRGKIGPYLDPTPGNASLNLLKMVRESVLHTLRTALHEVQQSGLPVRKDGVRVRLNDESKEISLSVVPLATPGQPVHFLVLLQETGAAESPASPGPSKSAGKKKRTPAKAPEIWQEDVMRLERELGSTREYMQAVIQDLEAANEELQSANEEILSSNEELQSTNEELDTAKEELQSTNEELNTVNEELHARNDELSRLNSDLVNLLASVQIAIVIVTNDLRIRRFTPMAEKVLNLISTDIGRPITQIKPNIDCPDLEKLITQVVDTVSTHEQHVSDHQGNWYSLRIRPYKNLENRIDGAVLALIELDEHQRGEKLTSS